MRARGVPRVKERDGVALPYWEYGPDALLPTWLVEVMRPLLVVLDVMPVAGLTSDAPRTDARARARGVRRTALGVPSTELKVGVGGSFESAEAGVVASLPIETSGASGLIDKRLDVEIGGTLGTEVVTPVIVIEGVEGIATPAEIIDGEG